MVLLHRDLALSIAHRSTGNRGVEDDDLEQVAYARTGRGGPALPGRRAGPFAVFAVPTIAGEVKKHFSVDQGLGGASPSRC